MLRYIVDVLLAGVVGLLSFVVGALWIVRRKEQDTRRELERVLAQARRTEALLAGVAGLLTFGAGALLMVRSRVRSAHRKMAVAREQTRRALDQARREAMWEGVVEDEGLPEDELRRAPEPQLEPEDGSQPS